MLRSKGFKSRGTSLKRVAFARKMTVARSKVRKGKKPKPLTSKKVDALFSLAIRARDNVCVRCGSSKNLTNSHFWSRTHSATRYDPENCDTLCWLPCHYTWEHEKHGDYRDFKIKQLGQERYDALERRARSTVKRSVAIAECLRSLEELTA